MARVGDRKKEKIVIIIDDDYSIRETLKQSLILHFKDQVKVYTSNNGVEGLGLIFVLNPDLVILDSTLPKYAGAELIDFLSSNKRLKKNNLSVIFTHADGAIPTTDYDNCVILDKLEKNFLKSFLQKSEHILEIKNRIVKKSKFARLVDYFIRNIIQYSNRCDLLMLDINKKRSLVNIPRYLLWVLDQIVISFNLMFLYLLSGIKFH